MRISIISELGETTDLAYRLQKEGHDVTMYIFRKGEQRVGTGLITVDTNNSPDISADLIINDDVFHGRISDRLRMIGKTVLGGSSITDRLENDRAFGTSVMQACGIKVPRTTTFSNFGSAMTFLEDNPGRYVFKPHGQQDRFYTYVAQGTDDMMSMLAYYTQIWPDMITFDLQEYIEGIEMAIGGWFNGTKFCKQALPNFEFKKLMNGDIGPNTGEMGTVMAYRTHSKLFTETLAKAEAFLKTTGYRGFIDIACIVNGDEAYGIEWTCRFGYPTIQIQDELHEVGSWGEFLYNLATGNTESVPADTSKWGVGVAYCALPWPRSDETSRFQDVPIFFPEDMHHIHTRDVWYDLDNLEYKQAGLMGYICVCTGSDVTIEKAKKKAYSVLNKVYVPGGFYRTDIGDRVTHNMPTLKRWGWVR